MLACEDSASIDCARLIRGTASMAKLVTPAAAIARTPSPLVNGPRNPISVVSDPSRAISSALGAATLTTTSQSNGASSTSSAPASANASSGISAPAPAPRCTRTRPPRRVIAGGARELAHDLGHQGHASLAFSCLLRDSDPHAGGAAYRVARRRGGVGGLRPGRSAQSDGRQRQRGDHADGVREIPRKHLISGYWRSRAAGDGPAPWRGPPCVRRARTLARPRVRDGRRRRGQGGGVVGWELVAGWATG